MVKLRQQGFTLMEVMVAMAIMALMGVMSWSGLDVMVRSQHAMQEQASTSAQMQVALQQWMLDLDQAWQPAGTEPMGWDGKVFRLTRRASQPELGLTVVAWAVREDAQGRHWMRWQSQPFIRMEQWKQAWEQAANWGRNTGGEQGVRLLPALQMEVFSWTGETWVNAQSSQAPMVNVLDTSELPSSLNQDMPQLQQATGVRMELTTTSGTLTKDWAALTVSEGMQ